MISKRIGITPKNDDYARLAAYIADAGHEGEKALMSWCAGCLGGDDYTEGIAEVLDTQDKNTRTVKSKIYHMVVSFRPEDEAKLTPEAFKALEERFATALGWSEHQRHCGVHKNTANLHMHIAYNMVNPENYTLHKEFRDFWIRDKLCRELEHEYGLSVDNGRQQTAPDHHRETLSDKAALVEAHTGQQSFESYAKNQREPILETLKQSQSWQALHEVLASSGLEIKPHGNGLVIKDRHSKKKGHAIKASALDRRLSQKNLEAILGPYVSPQNLDQVREEVHFQAQPLHRAPERGKLYEEFQAGIAQRKGELEAVAVQESIELASIRQHWEVKRREIERMSIAKRNRRNLLTLARKHEAEALAKARLSFQPQREVVRQAVPFTSWSGFLQRKAENGNEVALAVLRSRNETVEMELAQANTPPVKDWSQHGKEQFFLKSPTGEDTVGVPPASVASKQALRVDYAGKERALLEREDMSGKGKNRLLAVLRMEEVVAALLPEARHLLHHTVDGKGTVMFTLPGGGAVRDTGKEVLFSTNNGDAEAVARQYAVKKWGKSVEVEGISIFRVQRGNDEEHQRTRATDWER